MKHYMEYKCGFHHFNNDDITSYLPCFSYIHWCRSQCSYKPCYKTSTKMTYNVVLKIPWNNTQNKHNYSNSMEQCLSNAVKKWDVTLLGYFVIIWYKNKWIKRKEIKWTSVILIYIQSDSLVWWLSPVREHETASNYVLITLAHKNIYFTLF